MTCSACDSGTAVATRQVRARPYRTDEQPAVPRPVTVSLCEGCAALTALMTRAERNRFYWDAHQRA